MNLKTASIFIYLTLFLAGLTSLAQTPADYVNPFIGTTNYGATHPGAQYPHAMASVSPFNVAFKKEEGNIHEKDSEWNSRVYIHEHKYLTGYSHVNLSGVGCPELGSILTMPTHGPLELNPEMYATTYQNQEAKPGYFTHDLDQHQTKVELSSTLRAGISRYTFPKGENNILINLGLGLTNETGAMIKVVSEQEVEGYKTIGTFCYHAEDVRPIYFVARLSKPAKNYGAWKKMPKYYAVEGDWVKYNDTYKPYNQYAYELPGENVGAYFSFDTEDQEQITVKIGISYISIENARANLDQEIPDFDFDRVAQASYDRWNELLSRIQVEGSEENKTIFYTALYHSLIHPNIIQDVNGEFPLMSKPGIGKTQDRNRYSVFSLWDTYRNVHPFLSLIYPELQSEMVNTMVDMYTESGWMPKWELAGMETGVMVGDPAAPVIADTYLRGIKDFDINKAYEGLLKAGETGENNLLRPDHQAYLELGYVPVDNEDQWGGSVSTSQEYYISDWNIAQLSKALGNQDNFKSYQQRSMGYKKLFDGSTGMLRPKQANGSWYSPFNPDLGKNFEPAVGYVEGSAWNYRFYVPHDMPGLIKLNGGPRKFTEALQKTFDLDHFDMANEPDITYPFLFNYVKGEEWRTQKTVKELISKHYTNAPGGIPGNDDTGALSTWLLYSMMGIYPVCPGDMDYALFTPSFDKVTIQLNEKYYGNSEIVLQTDRESDSSSFINRMSLNGKPYKSYFLSHQDLTKGNTFTFHLIDKPKK
ncbi:MAG: GH92 family glycosyl hydrolase [Cytophagales bacterium]|nr:GH92 family glycosyl hydrolase [Cytophagales bacterium]